MPQSWSVYRSTTFEPEDQEEFPRKAIVVVDIKILVEKVIPVRRIEIENMWFVKCFDEKMTEKELEVLDVAIDFLIVDPKGVLANKSRKNQFRKFCKPSCSKRLGIVWALRSVSVEDSFQGKRSDILI